MERHGCRLRRDRAKRRGLNTAVAAAGASSRGPTSATKMSPLSDDQPGACGGGDRLFHPHPGDDVDHDPSILITLGIYFVLGLGNARQGRCPGLASGRTPSNSTTPASSLRDPLLVVIVLAVRKVHPTIAITGGAVTGGLVAVILQPETVKRI